MSRFSNIVSYVTHPIFQPAVLVMLCALAPLTQGGNVETGKWITPFLLVIITTMLIPLLFINALKKKGIVEDIMMRERSTRTSTYALMCLIFPLLGWGCQKLGYNPTLTLFCFEGYLLMTTILFINLYWKISIHCAGMGALTINTAIIFLQFGSPAAMLIATIICGCAGALTIYARIDTHSHTALQCMAGYGLGLCLPILFFATIYLLA